MIAALLLAAGAARRFGGPKLLEPLDDVPLLRWSARSLVGAPVDLVIAVLPAGADAGPLGAALQGLDVRVVTHERAGPGMGDSIARGIAALPAECEAVLIALGDVPLMDPGAIAAVVERFRAAGAAVVVPVYRGTQGHPVLFARSVFPELRALSGDRGARGVVERDAARRALVELDLPAPPDVDTPEDLAQVRRSPQYTRHPSRTRP